MTEPPTLPPAPAVSLRGMVKHFGRTLAVAGIDLDVARGSFFGLVGPNGAGKTTLLSMTTGLLRPDQGLVVVDGVDVWADPQTARTRMGVLPEGLRLFDRLSGPELLTYVGLLRRMPRAVVDERSAGLLRLMGLQEAGNALVIDYSAGMRKKIGLAAALLHDPRVLFLDEPFEAVDPVSARTIQEVLTRLVRDGATVIFSSHVMDLVQRLCDSVAILDHGRIVGAGRLDALPAGRGLEDVFFDLVGRAGSPAEELRWLGSSSA